MSSVRRIAGLGALMISVTACPYNGRFPVGAEDPALFDARLIGEWLPVEEGEFMESGRVWISRYDEDEYFVLGVGECPTPGGRARLARLGDALFLNIKSPGPDVRYQAARIEFNGADVVMRPLHEAFDSASSAEILNRMVSARLADSTTYDSRTKLRRTTLPMNATGAAAEALMPRACTLESEMPLGAPERLPELSRLIDRWTGVVGGDSLDVVTRRFNDTEFLLTAASDDEGEIQMRGFVTRVGQELFLHLQVVGEENYLIAHVTFAGRNIELKPLNRSVSGATSDEMRRFVAGRLEDPGIYTWESMRLIRR